MLQKQDYVIKNGVNKLDNQNNTKITVCIIISFALIIFSLVAPWLFTNFSVIDLTEETNAVIADTVSGLSGPFIAIAAAFLTFAAFIIQKRANDIQIESNNEQIKKNIKDSFENRLFKLIDTHRQNVSELHLENYDNT